MSTEIAITKTESRAQAFVRDHFAGGIGMPDTPPADFHDFLEAVWDAQTAGPAWQKKSVLDYEDTHCLWVSGSRNGALLFAFGPGAVWGFDGGTSEDLTPWATHGILRVPGRCAGDYAGAIAALRWPKT